MKLIVALNMWPFCGKNDWRWIFGKVWYGIVTVLFCKRLIQTTKHKYRLHDHFSKFLFTAICEFVTRTSTLSAWQVIRHFVSLRTWALFVIHTPFNIIFNPPKLCLGAAISIRNYTTNLHTETQIRIFVCSLSPIPLLSTSRNYKHSQSHRVTRFLRTFDYYCRTFKTASTLNTSTSKSVEFAVFSL